jgi:hypothetical protein
MVRDLQFYSALLMGPSLRNRSDVVELSLDRLDLSCTSTAGVGGGAGVAFVCTGDVGGDD